MNLFEVFPHLGREETRVLKDRALRLIALAGLVYDDRAFYFELGEERFWGRLPNGGVAIGVGAAKIQPDAGVPPHGALIRHLRRQWQCEVDFFPAGHAYVLSEDKQIVVLHGVEAATPYLFVLTAPQLGGAEVPDALVQAVYLLPVRRWRGKARPNLLQIQREALTRFLEPPDWELSVLAAQPWATLHTVTAIPDDARLRPVLALRGLQNLLQADPAVNEICGLSWSENDRCS
ncbi:MAG TPA: hypothetical protein PLJ78_07285 [Anaerolineae bacterium]|nr:hypothetical protein [Anaerolineae bacterium]HQK13725.1 hypothetical protein [Anaerolineae bacterium]